MYEQVAQLTLEPNGLNRRDDILVIFSFLVFLVLYVISASRSLLNNLYCDIPHLYNIVIPT